jgi:hypothetical protein
MLDMAEKRAEEKKRGEKKGKIQNFYTTYFRYNQQTLEIIHTQFLGKSVRNMFPTGLPRQSVSNL